MKEFCEYQIKCKEDTEDTRSCMAHLEEGLCFQCPYETYEASKRGPFPCEDACPPILKKSNKKINRFELIDFDK